MSEARPISRGAQLRRVALSVGLVLGLLFGGKVVFERLRALRTPPVVASEDRKITAVRVLPVRREAYQETLAGYGRAYARKRSVIAAEVDGLVKFVADELRPGVTVSDKPVLVKIDRRNAEAALAAAEGDLAAARARLALAEESLGWNAPRLDSARDELRVAENELERLSRLASSSSSSSSEVDVEVSRVARARRQVIEVEQASAAARHEKTQAQAAVDAAEARRQRAHDDLGRTEVRAPWPGVVASRTVEHGIRVTPGTPLFELLAEGEIEVAIRLSGSHLSEVLPGASMTLRFHEGGPVVWKGPIARRSPEVDPESRTFAVYADLKDGELLASVAPGNFFVGEVAGLLHEGVFAVPREAVVDGSVFLAVDRQGDEARLEARRPPVRRVLPAVVLFDGGLQDGDEVVLTNLDRVREDSRVRVVHEPSKDIRKAAVEGAPR